MRFPILTLALAISPFFAMADGGAGSASAQAEAQNAEPVLEVVRFRLTPGTTDAAFLAAARATEAPLRQQPGFVARALVKDEAGLWTDLVTWQDKARAERAAAVMMEEPAFGPFMALIDMPTVQMSHPRILWQMD